MGKFRRLKSSYPNRRYPTNAYLLLRILVSSHKLKIISLELHWWSCIGLNLSIYFLQLFGVIAESKQCGSKHTLDGERIE